MGYAAHPVGMTMQYPVADQHEVNTPLFNSPADWISPGFDDVVSPMQESRWLTNPPANDGAKVIISDTDHYSPFTSNALWAWKSFLRGHNPILYDLGIVGGVNPPDPSSGSPSFASHEAARYAMGDTRRFAERVQLSAMRPRGELSSTGYVLANPGDEYLVLQLSETAEPFNVRMADGRYAVEWHSVTSRESVGAGTLLVERATTVSFSSPFAVDGPVVVYLKRVRL